jgi:hypothetical protein
MGPRGMPFCFASSFDATVPVSSSTAVVSGVTEIGEYQYYDRNGTNRSDTFQTHLVLNDVVNGPLRHWLIITGSFGLEGDEVVFVFLTPAVQSLLKIHLEANCGSNY